MSIKAKKKTNNKKLLIIGIVTVVAVTLITVGLTFAFFTGGVIGNESATETVIETADLRLVFTDTEILAIEDALPGVSASKTFTIENTGTLETSYDIVLTELLNEFVGGELVYSLTSDNNGGSKEEAPVPTENNTILVSGTIKPGVIQTYTITIKFKETGSNQNSNMGANFSGKLQINATGNYNDVMSISLSETYGAIYVEETKEVVISGSNYGILTCESDDSLIATCELENNILRINGISEGTTSILLKESRENSMLKYEITVDPLPTLKEAMLRDNEEKLDINIVFSVPSSTSGTNGLYYTSRAEDTENGEVVYYYRGNVNNNNVIFGKYSKDLVVYRGYLSANGVTYQDFKTLEECNNSSYNYNCQAVTLASIGDEMCWRIIRTNEDGSTRLIYYGIADTNGNCPSNGNQVYPIPSHTYSYEGKYLSNAYVGYMYGTHGSSSYAAEHANINDSNAKIYLESWYSQHFTNFTKYLENAIYCNDRSLYSGVGYATNTTQYGAYGRLEVDYNPKFKCSQNNDKFTLSVASGGVSGYGNNMLSYPVGLITADELSFAGGVHYSIDFNDQFYLYTNTDFWTMTPKGGSSHAGVYTSLSGAIFTPNVYEIGFYSFPVISLKSDIVVSGTGTTTDPYIAKID